MKFEMFSSDLSNLELFFKLNVWYFLSKKRPYKIILLRFLLLLYLFYLLYYYTYVIVEINIINRIE